MMANLTAAGTLHSVLAMFCVAIGLLQLLRPKRGAGHRARGYAFVYAMLVADGAAMRSIVSPASSIFSTRPRS